MPGRALLPRGVSPRLLLVLAGLLAWLTLPTATRAEIPPGKGGFVFEDRRGNAGLPIQVWTYRPKGYRADSPIVFVMHGTLRNGETYREPWVPIADRYQCLVVVPEFSTKHYPGSRMYHFGNVRGADGQPVEEAKWTFSAIEHLFDHVKQETGSTRPGYFIFGHSAGSQFLHRLVLFKHKPRITLAVTANAGSYTMPTFTTDQPYGLGQSGVTEARLRQALTVPLVVLLGEQDIDPNDKYLPRDSGAKAQGAHRFERGHNFHRAAQVEAQRLGVEPKWTLQTVPGVGHDNARMAPAAARLFFAGEPEQTARPLDDKLQAALTQVDRLAVAELARDPIGGCTVGVVAGPDLVWAKSYGLADIQSKTPASNDHVYRVGSITKQFTALMLLQLADAGRVKLSDPAAKFFPELGRVQPAHADAPPVTLAQLATMTSGLAREPGNAALHSRGPASAWEKSTLAALAETRYQHEPGTRYLYSNIGYAALGAALSRAAKQPFTEYVHEHILTPLGMTSTAFEPRDTFAGRLARGYVLVNGKPDGSAAEREHTGRGYRVPNGALYSTVGDLARFLAFELGHGPEQVLKRSARDDNFSRVSSADGKLGTGYGIGFLAQRRGDLVFIGHGGAVAGYNAAAYVERGTRTGVIVLRNVGGGKFSASGLCLRALEVLAASRR